MVENKNLKNDTNLTEEELKNISGAGEPTEEVTKMHPGYSTTRDYDGGLSEYQPAPGMPDYATKYRI